MSKLGLLLVEVRQKVEYASSLVFNVAHGIENGMPSQVAKAALMAAGKFLDEVTQELREKQI